MQKIIFILLFFSLLGTNLIAQNEGCATQMPTNKMESLRAFQQQLDKGLVDLGKKSMKYVPLKIHIIGNSQGLGYYSVTSLMQTLCELNERFIPVGFHFFLADSITYIKNDLLNQGDIDAIYTYAEDYKMEGVVNVFFHGVGMQWCGVYFGGLDVVFVKNNCQGQGATTLTHELGHFFGLPHTFFGWEGGGTPSEIEKIDQSNCRQAGDGFCDTKPDYIATRWGCPYPFLLKDPNNVLFRADSSIYMSYSSDNCQSRFSAEQIAAMQNDLQSRRIDDVPPNLSTLSAPQKLSPISGQKNLNPTGVPLVWNSVPNAFAYHVQVARFGDWSFLNFDQLVFDTTVLVKLFGDWTYAWRVKAITTGNTCSSFGAVDSFVTKEIPAGIALNSSDDFELRISNPIAVGESISIYPEGEYEISISNQWGQMVSTFESSGLITIEKEGLYFVKIKRQDSFVVKRLIVLQNP